MGSTSDAEEERSEAWVRASISAGRGGTGGSGSEAEVEEAVGPIKKRLKVRLERARRDCLPSSPPGEIGEAAEVDPADCSVAVDEIDGD